MEKLQAAVNERVGWTSKSKRTPAQIVNTSLFWVALNAQKYTPKADPEKIITELNVDVKYVIDKRTNRAKPARKGDKFLYKGGDYDFISPQNLTTPLLKLIVLARANLSHQGRQTGTSRYNEITGGRWFLTKDQLKGGNAKIELIAEGMVSARRSSSSFYKAGWKPAMDILRPYKGSGGSRGSSSGERFAYNKDSQRLGTAVPAQEAWQCSGMIENHVGLHGGPLGPRQMANLIYYGSEPLAKALADEERLMVEQMAKWQADEDEKFRRRMK